ncbi:methyltransferase domain-containing protein [Candidatus Woesearchaeota archaeon]|nr:methyltransferase domain-containing protein [Candidatus Woesearchaeota archaeon]
MIYSKEYTNGYRHERFENTYKKAINLVKINKKDRILEIGCGDGYFVKKLMRYSRRCGGIDLNKDAIKSSKLKNCYAMNAEKLRFKKESFDKIFSIHTIEHIPDLEKAFSEMSSVLKKNGKIILIYPLEPIRGLFETYSSLRTYGHPFNGRKFHLHKLSLREVRSLAKRHNFNVIKNGFLFADFWLYPQFFSILEKK